jgi:hypothetical protein
MTMAAATLDDWRTAPRLFLAERVGEQLRAGGLFDRFGANMPLHHATRVWVGQGGEIGATSPTFMRWRAFSAALRHLNLRFEPAISRRTPLQKATTVIAQTVICAACGRAFFSHRATRFCSRSCNRRQLTLMSDSVAPLDTSDNVARLKVLNERRAAKRAAQRIGLKCQACGKPLAARRATARYCDAACRSQAWRRAS